MWISSNKFGMFRFHTRFLLLAVTRYVKSTRPDLCMVFCGHILGYIFPLSPTVDDNTHLELFLFLLCPYHTCVGGLIIRNFFIITNTNIIIRSRRLVTLMILLGLRLCLSLLLLQLL